MEEKKTLTVKDLCDLTGKKKSTIYRLAKELGRLPTVEEVKSIQMGRPRKYF